jgi:hypothetical protein
MAKGRKRTTLTEVEKFYVGGHADLTVEQLQVVVPVCKKVLEDALVEAKKVNVNDGMVHRSGATVLTQEASELAESTLLPVSTPKDYIGTAK